MDSCSDSSACRSVYLPVKVFRSTTTTLPSLSRSTRSSVPTSARSRISPVSRSISGTSNGCSNREDLRARLSLRVEDFDYPAAQVEQAFPRVLLAEAHRPMPGLEVPVAL